MFNGNRRFKLLRRLGAGGMGVVYEALDQQRDARVALKTLRETDADLLYRLKREFRGLRDLVHRNLVALDELFEEDGHWFFTMELLDGEDLHAYFQRIARAAAQAYEHLPTEPGRGPVPLPSALEATWPGAIAAEGGAAPPSVIDFDRVREVFGQVAEGLLAIHEAGKIHRDIKPSNIVVTRDGRAVILDFGLVTEQGGVARSGEGEIVGTVLYMAPEQAVAEVVGPPADWYSVGIMLYEVIAGQRPFRSPWGSVLAAQQQVRPRDPRQLNPACPEDLAELCNRLLEGKPGERPGGLEVLRRLGAGARDRADGAAAAVAAPRGPIASMASMASIASPGRVFVGREGELRELRRAFDDAGAAASITVFVHGESGIGKSTLLHHFAGTVAGEDGGAVVLSGQCREHEAVPFKAMDGIIDALSRHVCRLSEVAAAELVPQNAALLPGVFPVLGRIPAIAKAPRLPHAAGDPFQQRKRVFTALRELLCLLSERSRLIWVIDDMQWADSDSLHLLEELLRPPDPPRLLLLASVRSAEDAPALPQLPGEVRRVHLRPLEPEEAVRLAAMLLERFAPAHRGETARIVDETGGHPLFIGELVRHAAADRDADLRPLRLDEAIWARVSRLDAASLDVLKVLSLAVAPLSEDVLGAAARLSAGAFQRTVAALRAGYLVRGASPAHAALEVYHDRVRQAVVHHLGDAERVALNERIAAALEACGARVPPELLIHHLQGAGQLARAARKAREAAERALAGLAFEQASQLYEAALALGTWSDAERRDLLRGLGGALASAGRSPDAAGAYAKAAEGADPITQLSCRIQVADQLLQSGHLEEGTALLFSLLREHGHDLPDSPLQIAVRIMWYRARLAARGLRWTNRDRGEIPPRDGALLGLYKAAGRGLIMIDPVRALYFVIRGLHLAMDLGDRDLVMYFLLLESGFRGGEGSTKQAAFLARADALLRAHADPLFQTIYRQTLGMRTYLANERAFEAAFEALARTDEALAQAANAAWELSAGRFFLISSLHKTSDFARLRTYSERFIREAEQRGNLYTRTTIRRLANILWLVDDDPAGARAQLTRDAWISSTRGYHTQHWLELRARIEIAIYEGSAVDPALWSQHLRGLRQSFLLRLLDYRCETAWMMGRLALAEARRDPSQRRIARRSIARLHACKTHHAELLAGMLRATLAVQEGEPGRAIEGFRDAVASAEAGHVLLIAAAARRRRGALVGGDEGRDLAAAGERWMRDAGIKHPERMTYLVSPC